MERSLARLCAGALALASFGCAATELTVARFEEGVVPVLVSVNSQGKITRVQASQTLRPSMNRLLRKNLDEAIVAPALRDDRPVNSQMVLRMKLNLTPMEDGRYAAKFVPVDGKQVPFGAWFWRLDGDRYALVDDFRGPSTPRQAMPPQFHRELQSPPATPPQQPSQPPATSGSKRA
ncbi:energy transducer TonB [Pseudoxanthomonas winnipegensis]|uniref:energy transducer TonB n=1 Tax=Pseudoxanthomonas winnipegensis TaxID=2480810 RepID=UPI003F8608F3